MVQEAQGNFPRRQGFLRSPASWVFAPRTAPASWPPGTIWDLAANAGARTPWWQRKIENLHVTVRFLGNVADDRIDGLGLALVRGLGAVRSFDVAVRGIGAFPSLTRASVVWAGIDDPTGGLGRIAALVDTQVAIPHGPGAAERESRPFRAHVTLGRSKVGADVRTAVGRMAEQVFGRFTVDEAHMYESQLGRQGSTYVLRARAVLVPGDR